MFQKRRHVRLSGKAAFLSKLSYRVELLGEETEGWSRLIVWCLSLLVVNVFI